MSGRARRVRCEEKTYTIMHDLQFARIRFLLTPPHSHISSFEMTSFLKVYFQ